MKKGSVFLIVVAVLVILSAVIYYALKTKKGTALTVGDNTNLGDNADPMIATSFPLKQGSRGDEVKLLQTYINTYFEGNLIADGVWGSKTQAAYEAFFNRVEFLSSKQLLMESEYAGYIKPHGHLLGWIY